VVKKEPFLFPDADSETEKFRNSQNISKNWHSISAGEAGCRGEKAQQQEIPAGDSLA
jgi:hypothetical protein